MKTPPLLMVAVTLAISSASATEFEPALDTSSIGISPAAKLGGLESRSAGGSLTQIFGAEGDGRSLGERLLSVPEPAITLLSGLGLLALLQRRRTA